MALLRFRHRGGENRGNHEAGDTVREMLYDESGEDPVAHAGHGFVGVVLIEAVQHDTHDQEQRELKQDHQPARE